mmetsp:Transcript_64548/g.179578  ORF Transcript_64548/g.179578 Transcript_64548/m.179578 type:complete len:207 (+) Transcript_64548:118-738(+)
MVDSQMAGGEDLADLSVAEKRIIVHLIQTETFVAQWRGMMMLVACIVVLISCYQSHRMLKSGGSMKSLAFAFQMSAIAMACSTALFIRSVFANSRRREVVLYGCLVLWVPQLWMSLSSLYNRTRPAFTSVAEPMLASVVLQDFVLPDDCWPFSMVVFVVLYSCVRFTDRQVNSARNIARPVLAIHGLELGSTADGGGSDIDPKKTN